MKVNINQGKLNVQRQIVEDTLNEGKLTDTLTKNNSSLESIIF